MGLQKTNDEFVQELNKIAPDLVADEKYLGARTKIHFHCKAKNHLIYSTPDNILHKIKGCPFCHTMAGGEKTRCSKLNENNLFGLKMPDMVKYLKNSEEAFLYSYGSSHKTLWKCPCCGNDNIEQSFKYTYYHGIICDQCGSGDSYPNKYMLSILKQLKIDYEKEYSPYWIKPYRYDFYFTINNKHYIVEMDGGFHQTVDGVLDIDAYKDKMALEHDIEVIRIDCFYSTISKRENYIKTNILKSKLKYILCFNNVDFKKCHLFSLEKSYKLACDMWNNGIKNIDMIAKELDIVPGTVYQYLRLGEKNGAVDRNKDLREKERIEKITQSNRNRGTKLLCNETGEVFKTMIDAEKKYHCNISLYFSRNYSHSGKLPDGTKLTWTKLSNE